VIDVSEVLIDAGAECKQCTPKPALDCGRVWRFRLTDRRSELVSDDVIVCVTALLQRDEPEFHARELQLAGKLHTKPIA
jgi:hypothetical protein